MGVKVTSTLTKRSIAKTVGNIKKSFALSLKRDIADIIAEEILSGKSPVKGKRFKKYSSEYAKVKGRSRPVDMLDSGEMLDSLTVKQSSNGDVEIFFKDKKANFHNKGLGNLPKRRLLPTGTNETFKTSILKKIVKLLDRAVKKAFK